MHKQKWCVHWVHFPCSLFVIVIVELRFVVESWGSHLFGHLTMQANNKSRPEIQHNSTSKPDLAEPTCTCVCVYNVMFDATQQLYGYIVFKDTFSILLEVQLPKCSWQAFHSLQLVSFELWNILTAVVCNMKIFIYNVYTILNGLERNNVT